MSFRVVCRTDEVTPGGLKGFEIEGQPVLIASTGGKYYALRGKCNHMGGDLAKGKLEGTVLTCPRHGAKFDVTSGKSISGPKMGPLSLKGKDLPAYPVRIEGSNLQVDLG